MVTLYAEELVSHAVDKMRKFGLSQIPVMKDGKFVGAVDDSKVYQLLVGNPELRNAPISSIMQEPLPVVKEGTAIEAISRLITKDIAAVLVELENGKYHIITRHDLISAIA